ncbi:conjugal transfer protein TraI [Mucilaginibacter mali]|uniref:conjugal transfer protein TraI n=1 Tax=Mucilaginibacter mali TaxID=2740462 RepID=UPI001F203474|nr:conjugal transfer protein TraI [Mucilaginibacter mali]
MRTTIKTPTVIICLFFFLTGTEVKAQIPGVSLVTGVIKKVIVAIDLKVQQLQNQTLVLQNAEQQLENSLHLSSLNGISDWLSKEKELYTGYYQELNKVRGLIADYDAVKSIISKQKQLVVEYQQANALFHRDAHFSASELQYMGNIYNGILQESLRNLDELLLVVSDLSTRMDDAERLQKISEAAKAMQTNLDHLRQFNRQNAGLSLLRAKDAQDRQNVKQLYGIN